MTRIEKKYNEAMDRMGPAGRMERAFAIYDFIYEMLEFQVSKEHPQLKGRALRKKVAERMYFADPGALRLLAKVRDS